MSYANTTGSLRYGWEFSYDALVLADAARAKREFHQERHDWWLEQQESVMAEIRQSGIDVHQGVGAQYSNTKVAPLVTVDQTLSRDLAECHERLNFHKSRVVEYDAWEQTLSANGSAMLKLTHDDWVFFFGKAHALAESDTEVRLR